MLAKPIILGAAAIGARKIGALIYLQEARISPDAAFSVLDWTAHVHLHRRRRRHRQHGRPDHRRHLVMLLATRGLWGLLTVRFDVTLLPTRHRPVVDADSKSRA